MSSDDSDHELNSRLKGGNFAQKANDSLYIKRSDDPNPVVRVVSRNRSMDAKKASMDAGSSFVPRDARGAGSSFRSGREDRVSIERDSAPNDDSDNLPWNKTPKRFLAEDEPPVAENTRSSRGGSNWNNAKPSNDEQVSRSGNRSNYDDDRRRRSDRRPTKNADYEEDNDDNHDSNNNRRRGNDNSNSQHQQARQSHRNQSFSSNGPRSTRAEDGGSTRHQPDGRKFFPESDVGPAAYVDEADFVEEPAYSDSTPTEKPNYSKYYEFEPHHHYYQNDTRPLPSNTQQRSNNGTSQTQSQQGRLSSSPGTATTTTAATMSASTSPAGLEDLTQQLSEPKSLPNKKGTRSSNKKQRAAVRGQPRQGGWVNDDSDQNQVTYSNDDEGEDDQEDRDENEDQGEVNHGDFSLSRAHKPEGSSQDSLNISRTAPPLVHQYSHLVTQQGYQVNSENPKASFVHISYPRGWRTNLVQCTIVRDRTSLQGKLYPTYELYLEDPRKTLIVAQKMGLNRTSNYHFFDMTRGLAGSKLSKKAGNYLGKLRAKNTNRTAYTLLNHNQDKEEIAAVLFERPSLIDTWMDGNQPRKMRVLLPMLDDDGMPLPSRVDDNSTGRTTKQQTNSKNSNGSNMIEVLEEVEETKRCLPREYRIYQTKEPTFINGNYRLNFHGRVTVPSVKNFQIVSEYDVEDVVCQFGKVDGDLFHLDYKAPLNAFQAFALALCQFNL